MSCSARDAYTYDFSVKTENGNLLNRFIRTLSEDGNTLTDTITALGPNGPVNFVVSIFDKVEHL